MAWFLVGILAMLIQIGIIVGIVVLIVKLVSKKGKTSTTTEGAGVMVRRLFVYSIMLAMLVLVGIGIGGLLDEILQGSDELVDSTSAAARSIAFVVVGLPVYAGLTAYTLRKLRTDPSERSSIGLVVYLTIVLIGTLVTVMSLTNALLASWIDGDTIERLVWIHLVIWAAVWVGHWLVARRWLPASNAQVHLVFGSAVGLMWAFAGSISTLEAVLSSIYEVLFLDSITSMGIDDLLRPATILLVGLLVWAWYWIVHTRESERTTFWHAYVLLVGVLAGATAAIVGSAIGLFLVTQWILGDAGGSAAGQFAGLSGAAAVALTGLGLWIYHGQVLGRREDRERTEVDRVYDYLLAAAGLIVAASGLTTLLVALLKWVFGGPGVTESEGDVLSVAITLLVVGAPLWWRYWRVIQRYREEDAQRELGSMSRRIYIIGLFGVAAVTAVVSLIVFVFILFEDILEGSFGKATIDSSAVAISLIVTMGTLAWYHIVVFREDRAEEIAESEPEEAPPEEPEQKPKDHVVSPGSLEAAIQSLYSDGGGRVLVTPTEDGFRIEPAPE